jgi:C-terminal processing protease CtpA/Prc
MLHEAAFGMTRLFVLAVLFLAFVAASAPGSATISEAMVQQGPDPYTIGASLFVNPMKGCPIIVTSVWSNSPAERAGIRAGDRLLEVDGKNVSGMSPPELAKLLRSDQSRQVALELYRRGKKYKVLVKRDKLSAILARAGKKRVGAYVVPLDASDAEVKRMEEEEGRQIAHRVFPLHYPLNTDLYYCGFEIFVFADPPQIAVGGLEQGPASRAGIHQGDVILSVNGVDPKGKSPEELEALFSSHEPKDVTLVVDRITTTKSIKFRLEKTSDVLKENHNRLVDGKVIPEGAAVEDMRCGDSVK